MSFRRPRSRDRNFRRFRLSDLQDKIIAKSAKDVLVDIEVYGDTYVVPLSIANLLAHDDGTIKETVPIAEVFTHTPAAATDTICPIPDGEIWEILTMFGFAAMDATVIDRVWRFRITGETSLTLTNGSISYLGSGITLSASQDGQIVYGLEHNLIRNDNGTQTITNNENVMPLTLEGGSTIEFYGTNKQAADVAELKVMYRRVG
jgi:hypothetical protein